MTSDSVDLLAFGPHPDDLEIGLGGTIARQTAAGLRVGLCDLTAGEMGSNGSVTERLAEAEAARVVLGARVAREPADGRTAGSAKDPIAPRSRGCLHPASSSARRGDSVLVRSPSRSRGGERDPHRGGVQRGSPPLSGGWRARGRRTGSVYYFINDAAPPSFLVDVSDYYERKRRALDCHASQFTPPAPTGSVATRLNTPLFRQMIESRDAQFGALAGVRWAEGFVVREPVLRNRPDASRPHEHRHRLLRLDRRQRHHRHRAREGAGVARPRRPHPEQRHARAARRLPAGAFLPPRRDAELPAVPRAAVPAVARQQDRAGCARRAAGHRPRTLRDPACHGRLSGAADPRRRATAASCHAS